MKEAFEMKIHTDEQEACMLIADSLLDLLPPYRYRPIVVVCIGTDRSTGDALGPLIGSFLEEAGLRHFHVYGTLEEPVHAVNLEEKLEQIRAAHLDPFMIGIDACLGRLKNVGMLKVGTGPVKPGAGVKKVLPEVGEIHMTGIVNVSGYMEFLVLQNTRLQLVMNMAKKMAAGIIQADRNFMDRQRHVQLAFNIGQQAP